MQLWIWGLPMFRGGADAGRYTASLVLYTRVDTVEVVLVTIRCVEMDPVCAQASVVVHGKPRLLTVSGTGDASIGGQSHSLWSTQLCPLRAGLVKILSVAKQ